MTRRIAPVVAAMAVLLNAGPQASAQEPQRGRGAPPDSQAPPAQSGQRSEGRRGNAPAGGGQRGRGGAGRTASIVLGTADVARVARGVVDATISVSGDLRAFESNTVRSRIDGVIEKVFVREGQSVAAGTVLAKFESSEQEAALRSADADIAAAKSDAETQRWNADQSRELFKVGAIAERDFRLAEQAADAALARLAASESRQRAATNVLRDTKVTAPFAGTLEKRLVQDGENTPRGTQMFTMVRTSTLELIGAVPARLANDVKAGQVVRFTADGRAFTGRVARVSPTVDPASRSVAVYVTIPNPRGALKGNTFATGQVVTTTIQDALVVPVTAVRDNADGTRRFVYKIQGGELAMAYVQVGITDEAREVMQVLAGVREQDQVVVGSPGTLGPGMAVTIIGGEGARGGGRRGQKPAP